MPYPVAAARGRISQAAGSENLILNGNFDTDLSHWFVWRIWEYPPGWNKTYDAIGEVASRVTPDRLGTGGCLDWNNLNESPNGDCSLPPGCTTVKVCLWMKCKEWFEGAEMFLCFGNSNDDYGSYTHVFTSADWEYVEATFSNIYSDTSVFFTQDFFMAGLYIDDIAVYDVS